MEPDTEPSKTTKRSLEPRDWEFCLRCKIRFENIENAQAHFSTFCYDIFCKLCQKVFYTAFHLADHLNDIHDVGLLQCLRCGFEIEPGDDITVHWRETGCHIQCGGCLMWQFQEEIDYHLKENPTCRRAHKKNKTEQAPAGQSVASTKTSIKVLKGPNISFPTTCFGCNQGFEAASSLTAHWTSGSCRSHITVQDVHHTFATFYDCESLLPFDDRQSLGALLTYKDVTARPGVFRCQCSASFRNLNQLVNHAESRACSMELDGSRRGLIRHLEDRVYYDSVVRKVNDLKAKVGDTETFIRSSPVDHFLEFQLIAVIWDCSSAKLGDLIQDVLSHVRFRTPGGTRCLIFDNFGKVQEDLDKLSEELATLRNKFREYDPSQSISRNVETAGVLFIHEGNKEARAIYSFLDEVAAFRDIIQLELTRA
ncbi:hypothetical protein TWF696_006215 [Orbilia brochopaga]|uniref:C2H2-type domain-containing protein n=1 Tax=Orbilia brochopaga TaxID=3140254 RepID=A0AAV9V200_9PEZI